MKNVILTLGLAAITAIGWGQTQRSQYNPPYAPSVFTFADSNLEVDPLDDLKYGSMYLLRASNYNYIFLGCVLAGSAALSNSNPNYVLGNALIFSGTLVGVVGYIQHRKGLERLYLGMNGITIKLN